ncbi:alpha/beta fold hydrolase [Thiomicrospira sp. ALE5]|uniref:alpha/beta fold hydrolase n=1 Tax=Thiomicrospira sp. ALE5 TaxID=748650 RepID=UPI0008E297A0|nr:alpha/beta hydrolase [Thiomicrospira sp. ALE5]SFR55627.1 Pimeloyl-ACP methyl ester carboxylesterase [Thiomicrospira sp. ALE5]
MSHARAVLTGLAGFLGLSLGLMSAPSMANTLSAGLLQQAEPERGFISEALFFETDDRPLQYQALGDGHHTILLLGGGPGFSSWNLTPIQEYLSQDFRVLLMDMRGIGSNKHHDDKPDALLEQWLEDLEHLRRHENPGQFILIGHSWGALMAQLYAQQNPTRVQRLILLNPVDPELSALDNLTQQIDAKQRKWNLAAEPDDPFENYAPASLSEQAIVERQLTQVLPTYFYHLEQGLTYAQLFDHHDFELAVNHAVWQSYRQQPLDLAQMTDIAKRRAIEWIGCREDILMPGALTGYQAWFPKLSYQLLEQCNHFPWEEQPTAFYAALDQALTNPPPEDDYSDLTAAERAWLLDDSGLDELVKALDATQRNVRFSEPFNLDEDYYMTNHIALASTALTDGWGKLTQCHYNLDPVQSLQIVYNPDNTANIEILSDHGIEMAWVEGPSVQLNGIQPGASICVEADTQALIQRDHDYVIERGPFMRRFLDGFYPLHVKLSVSWPNLPLVATSMSPPQQTGVYLEQTEDSLSIDYWFRGELRTQLILEEK